MENERLQELFLLIGDKVATVNKKWWYALGIAVIATIPVFFLAKYLFVSAFLNSYTPPQITYTAAVTQPLTIIDKKIFQWPNNAYSGYFKIKNINNPWGVSLQRYKAEFITTGGSVVSSVSSGSYILPSSEKLIVIPLFISDKEPTDLKVELVEPTNFILKPEINVDLSVERIDPRNTNEGFVVSAAVKNLTPFRIRRIDLPVILYNDKHEIIGVSTHFVSDVESGEIRSFQYTPWPTKLMGSIRVEIKPEINIFNRDIFLTPDGISPFDDQ